MLLLLFVLFLASGPGPEAKAAERFAINLKDEVAVESNKVYLKDVADLYGPDKPHLEKLADIFLCVAPAFGETSILSRHQIGEQIEPAVGRLPISVFAGATAVQIRLQGRQVTEDEIASILKSFIMESTPWKESEIAVRSIGNLKGIELPPTEGSLRISSSVGITGQRKVLAPIEILHAGKEEMLVFFFNMLRIKFSQLLQISYDKL